jgi:four helix bundle protein
MAVRNYRDLIVWQKAMDLVVAAYVLADAMPPSETFGLSAQLKRAAVSVPVNIPEGEGRGSQPEFRRYLRIAYGSLREIETEVLIAIRLGFTSQASAQPVMGLATEVGRLINGLQRPLVDSRERSSHTAHRRPRTAD